MIEAVPVRRRTARLLVVADARLLLLRIGGDSSAPYWLPPGGGLEPGEDYEAAARRELREEVGLERELGPLVWTSRYLFTSSRGVPYDQSDRYFLVSVDAPFPLPHLDHLNDESIDRAHWWSVEELEQSDEDVFPLGLAELFADLLSEVPSQPRQVARGRR